MNIADVLRYVLNPHEPDAGWSTRPPEWMTREAAAVEGLEPNALEAVKNETGIFWLNFHDMIAPAIAIYLRASGLRSIREDFQRVNEACDRLGSANVILRVQVANLHTSAAVSAGEVVRLEKELAETRRLLDSALIGGGN